MSTERPREVVIVDKSRTRDRVINIDGMDDSSIPTVVTALKTVKDLSVDAVRVGLVNLRAATHDEAIAACAAIKSAGFESREAPRPETMSH